MSHSATLPEKFDDQSRQFELLLNSVTDYAIYMLDREGHVQTWNPGGERIKGYLAGEIIGSHFSRFYTEEDVARGVPMRNLATADETGRYSGEGWRVRKNGTRFYASVVIDPIRHDGKLVGFAKITRDVTERVEAEQQLERARQSLLQAQKMEAIGKLTLGLAHDFNNLLTIIVNSLEVIGNRTRDPRTTSMVETAMRASERGILLSRQLLTFGKGQNLAPERCDVNDMLAKSEDLLRRCAGQSVRLTFEPGADLPPADLDKAQFEAALLNLISNSRDSMVAGGDIVVRTSLRTVCNPHLPDPQDAQHIAVDVTDNGCGIPPENHAKVFEPFFTTKDVGRGSGLGLSQVIGFAVQSGGFAELQSALGEGTTVSLYFPIQGGDA
jgi:PAS domain S-box-containing protein